MTSESVGIISGDIGFSSAISGDMSAGMTSESVGIISGDIGISTAISGDTSVGITTIIGPSDGLIYIP
jgi:hypothetical protein